MVHHVWVRGLLPWIEPRRLLGPGDWTFEGRSAHTTLVTHAAADLDARLRGIGVGGGVLEVVVEPALKRPVVRAARTTDARRRRDTTPGFTRPGTRLDAEGKMSLTPEALALAIGQRAAGKRVIDAGCGAGGNSIGFARAGCSVVAIEADAGRLADARHNARVYGVERQIQFIHGRSEDVLPDLTGDLLFLDPPWGADWSRSYTTLADLPPLPPFSLPETWIKLPPSFDVSGIEGARPEAWYGLAPGDERRVKFLILRVRGG